MLSQLHCIAMSAVGLLPMRSAVPVVPKAAQLAMHHAVAQRCACMITRSQPRSSGNEFGEEAPGTGAQADALSMDAVLQMLFTPHWTSTSSCRTFSSDPASYLVVLRAIPYVEDIRIAGTVDERQRCAARAPRTHGTTASFWLLQADAIFRRCSSPLLRAMTSTSTCAPLQRCINCFGRQHLEQDWPPLHVRRPRCSPFAFAAVVVPRGCVLAPTSCSFAGAWRHGSSPASCDTDLHAEADSLPGRWYRCISSLKSCSGGRAAGERRLHRSLSRLTSRNLLRCRSEPEAGHSWAAIKSCWLRRPGRSASICKPGC